MRSYEDRWATIRTELQADHDQAVTLADNTADHLKARFHRGQVSLAARYLERMDALDRNGQVEPL